MFFFFKKPTRWFSSDWHFGHKNVISYCNRPWSDIETMNDAMLDIINSTVNKKDELFFLGDFALNTNKYMKLYCPKIKCENRIFIAGNHDWIHPVMVKSQGKLEKRIRIMKEELGWKNVYTKSLDVKLKNGYYVLMNHFPYLEETSEYDLRYKELRPIDKGQWLLHGHLHGVYRKKNRMIDVAFDGDLKLWSEDEIIELIRDKREFIETPISEYYRQRERSVLK